MIKLLVFIIALFILLLVLELIREEKLTFKYAFGWLAVSLLTLGFAFGEGALAVIAHSLGFVLVSNFIFFGLLMVFVFLSLLMTVFLCQQNSRNDIMAQKIATLEYELKQINKPEQEGPSEKEKT